jgi:hypothetical protein
MTKRRLRLSTSLVLIVWLLLSPLDLSQYGFSQTVAADGITILNTGAEHRFAQDLTFTLQARSEAEITQVYLFFQVEGSDQTESQAITFDPATEVDISYVHDLRRSPLPPFAPVTYWWQIEDTAGGSLNTASEPSHHEYTDNRFEWEDQGTGGITVHWIVGDGDPIFGQAALDIAAASLEEINAELDAPVPESIDIYIYNTQPNLDAAMALTGRPWVVGQAHPELGVIIVAIPFDSEGGYKWRMRRYIPHEITHLLVYNAATAPKYRYVPEWLDEGLATANEQLPTPEHALILEEARTQGKLLPLEDLCNTFSPNPQVAFLAYAQSGSLVSFIRERYGAPGIRGLLNAYASGASCSSGVQEALNTSLADLEVAWRSSLEGDHPVDPTTQAGQTDQISQAGIWLGLWLLTLLVTVPWVGRFRRKE